jgi:hypothetical protein
MLTPYEQMVRFPTPSEMVDQCIDSAARDLAMKSEAFQAELMLARNKLQSEVSKRPMGDGRAPMRSEDMSGMMSTPVMGQKVTFMKGKVDRG